MTCRILYEYRCRNTDGISKSLLGQYNTRSQMATNAGQKSLSLLILLIRFNIINKMVNSKPKQSSLTAQNLKLGKYSIF